MKKEKIAVYRFERKGESQGFSQMIDVVEAYIIEQSLPSWEHFGCCTAVYNPKGTTRKTIEINGIVCEVKNCPFVEGIEYSIQLRGGEEWTSETTIRKEINKLETTLAEATARLQALKQNLTKK